MILAKSVCRAYMNVLIPTEQKHFNGSSSFAPLLSVVKKYINIHISYRLELLNKVQYFNVYVSNVSRFGDNDLIYERACNTTT